MASRSKKKTTMAKLNREQKVRERRREKELRKEARQQAAAAAAVAGPSDALPAEPEAEPRD
jgi:hypothetical protein